MDGNYQVNESLIDFKRLKKRSLEVFHNYVDLKLWQDDWDYHIDKISDSFMDEKNWLEGVSILHFLFNRINAVYYGMEYKVMSYISLESSSEIVGLDVSRFTELSKMLSITPPSISIYPRGSLRVIQIENLRKYVGQLMLNGSAYKLYYYEDFINEIDIARNILIY